MDRETDRHDDADENRRVAVVHRRDVEPLEHQRVGHQAREEGLLGSRTRREPAQTQDQQRGREPPE